MKKSVLIALLGVASVAVTYGQGQINFSNYYLSTQTTGVTYGNGPSAGEYVGPEITAELFYGDSTATSFDQLQGLASSITPFGLGFASGPDAVGTGAGWFNAGSIVVPGDAGSTYMFAIQFTGVYQGQTYVGITPLFSGSTQSSSLSPTPFLPDGLRKGDFTVMTVVPEPSTLALAGISGIGLLMALRRKKA